MATSRTNLVIHHLCRFVLLRDVLDFTDQQLLDAFIDHRDEVAFEALVRRHGAMVMGVCRRILRSHHDAEDAFQATFLVLAHKAAGLAARELVANWLYGVAYHTALKAKAASARRRARECEAADMPKPEAAATVAPCDLQAILDHELSRLPEKYRAPIVLCDLEGKSRKEAAQQVGCPEGTIASRLARGRTLLAKRLVQRGVTLSAAAVAGEMPLNVASASVSTVLISTTSNAATLYAAGQAVTGVVSAQVAALAKGVLKTMVISKLKTITLAVVVLGLTAFGGGDLLTRPMAASPLDDRPAAAVADQPNGNSKQAAKPAENAFPSFQGRFDPLRTTLLEAGGGTKESEAAVAEGLGWLARHQEVDGRWKLDGRFPDKGNANDPAATALGLLPFLGAGKTHKLLKDNPYNLVVDRALRFLVAAQDKKANIQGFGNPGVGLVIGGGPGGIGGGLGGGGALGGVGGNAGAIRDGSFSRDMYAHALCTIAICEAYGMTKDGNLKKPAQAAIHFIVAAQHEAGGWRYSPGQAGDTSVTGWQIAALKTAQMSGLDVPVATLRKAQTYLENDALHAPTEGYGYTDGANATKTMTAVALLCRQKLQGWGSKNARMIKGVDNFLKPNSPKAAVKDVYFYYYATQVMHQFGGDEWKNWNDKFRDLLVKSQNADDTKPEVWGSWSPAGDQWGQPGGQLMVTSLNLLSLQVYYRYSSSQPPGAGGQNPIDDPAHPPEPAPKEKFNEKPVKIRVYIENVNDEVATITASCMLIGEIDNVTKPARIENLRVAEKAKITDRGKDLKLVDLKLLPRDTHYYLFLKAYEEEFGFEVVGIETIRNWEK
jgi:RNA polymerase sigma factor (sigma-70 family)